MKEHDRTPQSLLFSVEQFFRDEEELFGESLIIEQPAQSPEPTMPARKSAAQEEPLLFDLPVPEIPPGSDELWRRAASLDDLHRQICECQKCPLGGTRTKFVFGVGNPNASLLLIGEAPGADEDLRGEPFVGRAGQLLNKILESVNFRREEVYICNILKCRPPNNRNPQGEEVEQCFPYLTKQVDLVRPKLILCLGRVAAEYLLRTTESLGRLRGRVLSFRNIPVMVTYHPAALLRNPNWKRPTWEDVQAVRKLHDELIEKS